LLLVIASFAAGFSSTPFEFGLAQGLVRGATSGLSTLGVVWLAEHLAPRIRAYGVGIYGAAGSFGAGIAVIALPLAEADWRIPYYLTGIGLLLLPVLAHRIREPSAPARGPHRRVDTSFLRARPFLIAGLASLFPAAFSSLGLAFLTERLVNQVGFTSGEAVLLTLGGGTIGALGFFLGGRLADSWGRKPTTILALLSILSGGIAVYNSRSASLMLPALIVSAFGSFAYVPAASIHRAELFRPEQRATASSALTWVGTLGSAAGLLTGGLIIDELGLSATMTALGSGVLVAALLTLGLPETRGLLLDRWEEPGDQDQQPGEDHHSDGPPNPAQAPVVRPRHEQ
jgi:predicted MFS family arabinose efflux permease